MLNRKLRKQLREILKVYKRVEDSKTVEPERIKDDPRLERDLKQQRSEEELIRRWKTGDPDMDEETNVLAEKLDAAGQPHLRLVR